MLQKNAFSTFLDFLFFILNYLTGNYLKSGWMNVLNVFSFQNNLFQSKRQHVLQLVTKNPSAVPEIRVLTRSRRFRGSDQTLSGQMKVEALETGVVREEAGQVEVFRATVDAHFEVAQIRHHSQRTSLKKITSE
jgi:hypothetical protein